jgi:hypothetical protein
MLQTTRMTRCGLRGHSKDTSLHCTEDPIYLFPEMQLCGLFPNSYIHVSASDLYIPRICLHICQLQENRQSDPGNTYINRSKIHECENWATEHYTVILFKKYSLTDT